MYRRKILFIQWNMSKMLGKLRPKFLLTKGHLVELCSVERFLRFCLFRYLNSQEVTAFHYYCTCASEHHSLFWSCLSPCPVTGLLPHCVHLFCVSP